MTFKDGDEVIIDERAGFRSDLTNGIVLGKAILPLPVLGEGYIIDFGCKISEEYPFSAGIVFEQHLQKVRN